VVTEQTIRDLPINRRDYLTFTLLAPAVSDSTGSRPTRIFVSNRRPRADFPSTAATAAATALPWTAAK
jgi:hypothetical protein